MSFAEGEASQHQVVGVADAQGDGGQMQMGSKLFWPQSQQQAPDSGEEQKIERHEVGSQDNPEIGVFDFHEAGAGAAVELARLLEKQLCAQPMGAFVPEDVQRGESVPEKKEESTGKESAGEEPAQALFRKVLPQFPNAPAEGGSEK